MLRDVDLAREQAEDGEGAEEDDEEVREQREKARVAICAVIVHQAPASDDYQKTP